MMVFIMNFHGDVDGWHLVKDDCRDGDDDGLDM